MALRENTSMGNYIAQADELLRDFDKSSKHSRNVLKSHLGDETAERITGATRQEFQRLIPAIPYLGSTRGMAKVLIVCTMTLALYRVLKSEGKNVEEIGKMIVEIEEERIQPFPRFLLRLYGSLIYRHFGKILSKKAVEVIQKHEYPEGWAATFIEGDGSEFDFGIDYSACGICKFFHQQGADEITRYVCLGDYIFWGAMDVGFFRTTTLAEGENRCDFRWKKGRAARAAWPPPWLDETSL
jgi:hypothetical protein